MCVALQATWWDFEGRSVCRIGQHFPQDRCCAGQRDNDINGVTSPRMYARVKSLPPHRSGKDRGQAGKRSVSELSDLWAAVRNGASVNCKGGGGGGRGVKKEITARGCCRALC